MRRIILVAVLTLVAACGDGTATDDATNDAAATTSAETVATTQAASTTTSTAAEATHEDEDAGHDDEATHDDEDAHEDEDATASNVVVIVMTEFAFEPASLTVSAGQTIAFEVVNEGSIPHEFRLSNAHRIEEHLESGHADHGDNGHHSEGGDVFIEVAPGQADQLVVTFPDDATIFTEMACLIPGHYEAGMLGEVIYA